MTLMGRTTTDPLTNIEWRTRNAECRVRGARVASMGGGNIRGSRPAGESTGRVDSPIRRSGVHTHRRGELRRDEHGGHYDSVHLRCSLQNRRVSHGAGGWMVRLRVELLTPAAGAAAGVAMLSDACTGSSTALRTGLAKRASTKWPNEPLAATVQGNSVDTKTLVGRIEIWEGVRDDVDWMKLASPQGR